MQTRATIAGIMNLQMLVCDQLMKILFDVVRGIGIWYLARNEALIPCCCEEIIRLR